MFFNKIDPVEVDLLKDDVKYLEKQYFDLLAKYHRLMNHLGIVENTIPEHKIFVAKENVK